MASSYRKDQILRASEVRTRTSNQLLKEAFKILRIDDVISSKSSGTNRAGRPSDKLDGKDFD
jgi:hypothetical protein